MNVKQNRRKQISNAFKNFAMAFKEIFIRYNMKQDQAGIIFCFCENYFLWKYNKKHVEIELAGKKCNVKTANIQIQPLLILGTRAPGIYLGYQNLWLHFTRF